MKKILPALFCFVIIVSCENKEKANAVKYNDAIVKEVDKADSLIQVLFSFDMFSQFPLIGKEYSNLLEESKQNLQRITPIQQDDTLRLTALGLLDTYNEIVNKDCRGIYEIMIDSTYNIADSIRVDSFMFEMYGKWQAQSKKIATQQQSFAQRHGITLEKK
ncbi:MAG: hypothetical protein ACKVPJ_05880 [Chitinophagales bacterium]